MPFKLILFCLLLFSGQPVLAISAADLLPAEQAFKVSAKAASADRIEIVWEISEGYYLYRDKLRFASETPEIELGEPVFPAGEPHHDKNFGDTVIYRHRLAVPISLSAKSGASSLRLQVRYHGCSDQGVCYPPQKAYFDLKLPQAVGAMESPLKQLVKNASIIKLNLFEDELLPPDQAFQFFASVKDERTLHVNWLVAEGYYLYREKVQFELLNADGIQLGAYDIPRGTPKEDEAFGMVEIFHNELEFDLPLIRGNRSAQTLILQAKYQGCADRGVCYPPMSKIVDLDLPPARQVVQQTPEKAVPAKKVAPALSEHDQIVESLHNDSFAMTLLSFFGFGLLLSFTPCIFPMIPILSGIIVGHGHRISAGRGFLLSLSYVLASALTYTVFGILAALFGSNLQTTFQQPWIIVLFSAIFVLLSLSMFGFYNLELPKSLQTRLHNSSERHRDGSMLGAAIMGALSSLIVGPCVAAPLAATLIYIGQTGDAVLGGTALFTMGFGMGVPLLLLGASAGKLLPKAGSWLNSTKAVFGVVMLAVAAWMLDRVLPGNVMLLLWASLLIFPAVYLNALDPLPENCSGWRKLWKGLGLMMLAYGLLLLIGFSLGNSNPLKPLHGLGSASDSVSAAESETGVRFERVSSGELADRLKQVAAEGRPVMLDFYADWCISCKEMEAYTFTDLGVKQALQGFVLLQVDVTENSESDQALLTKYHLIGPPAILFFDKAGHEQAAYRVIGFQDAEAFIQSLRRVEK